MIEFDTIAILFVTKESILNNLVNVFIQTSVGSIQPLPDVVTHDASLLQLLFNLGQLLLPLFLLQDPTVRWLLLLTVLGLVGVPGEEALDESGESLEIVVTERAVVGLSWVPPGTPSDKLVLN